MGFRKLKNKGAKNTNLGAKVLKVLNVLKILSVARRKKLEAVVLKYLLMMEV